ncbi:MAG: nucleotidyltransferase domain-containing protein [Nanoarchaeota archaeon]
MLQKKDKDSILFFNKSSFKIAKLIFNCPNKVYHIRMLERETGLSTTAIKDAIKYFKEFEIISIDSTTLTTNIKANLESESYRFYKFVFNIYRLKRYLFIDNLIRAYNNPEAIVLFGSFARGEDIEESDIDILIITSNEPEEYLTKLIFTFEKELNRKINIHTLPSLEKSSVEFKNNLANGIVLYGYLKVI